VGRNAKAQLVDERERTLEDSHLLTPRALVHRVYCAVLYSWGIRFVEQGNHLEDIQQIEESSESRLGRFSELLALRLKTLGQPPSCQPDLHP
jgi:hypothetical protein